jgi:hypothetical protein
MPYSIYTINIVNTKIGVVARQKVDNAELCQYNRIWLRKAPGNWEQANFTYNKIKSPISSGFLEALYQNMAGKQELPFEDGW